MFKTSTNRDCGVGVTLMLEGRLTAAWVDEFAGAVATAMSEAGEVTLDLDGLSFADALGVAVIRSTMNQGARVSGGSPFIGALLQEEGRQ